MDIAMPGTDGLEASRMLHEDAILRRIPVIALTAHDTGGFKRAAADAGIDGYLTKPIDFERLHKLIRNLLDNR
jgi:CheY-like chemotaxis protein